MINQWWNAGRKNQIENVKKNDMRINSKQTFEYLISTVENASARKLKIALDFKGEISVSPFFFLQNEKLTANN